MRRRHRGPARVDGRRLGRFRLRVCRRRAERASRVAWCENQYHRASGFADGPSHRSRRQRRATAATRLLQCDAAAARPDDQHEREHKQPGAGLNQLLYLRHTNAGWRLLSRAGQCRKPAVSDRVVHQHPYHNHQRVGRFAACDYVSAFVANCHEWRRRGFLRDSDRGADLPVAQERDEPARCGIFDLYNPIGDDQRCRCLHGGRIKCVGLHYQRRRHAERSRPT